MAEQDPWEAAAEPDLGALEAEHGLPKGLLTAIKATERSGKAAVSPKGALGEFQFMPATAKAYGLDDPTDTPKAAAAVARYMADAMKRYGTSDPLVLAAEYNGGPAQAKAVLAGKVPPAAETQKYLANVSKLLGIGEAQAATPATAQRDPWERDPWEAAPTTQKTVTQKTKAPEEERMLFPGVAMPSMKNLAGAALEPMATIATGAVAQPISGLAGLASAIMGGDVAKGAKLVEKIQDAMTYRPRTVGGQNALKVIGAPFELLSEGANKVGETVLDVTGSPVAAAAAKTALEAGPQILGAKAVGKAVPAPAARAVSPEVATLTAKGISLPPGELLGGGWARAEEALSRRPLVGIPIRAAQERSIVDFNRAFVNDSLADIGQRLPEGLRGHEAIAYTKGRLSDAYTNLLSQMKGDLDAGRGPTTLPAVAGEVAPAQAPSLRMELDGIKALADSSKMPRKYAAELGRIIDEEIINRFDPGGKVLGETVKEIQSKVRAISKEKMRNENYDVRNQGLALKEANAAIDRMVREVNPEQAGALKAIDAGYAKFKIAQKAVAGSTNAEGLVTPSGFMRAIRTKDPSKDKSAYTAGTALQQGLAKAASALVPDVLPERVNLSKLATHAIAGRSMRGAGLIGAPGGAAIAALISPAYSATGSALLRKAFMGDRMAAGKRAAQSSVFGFGSLDEDSYAPPKRK